MPIRVAGERRHGPGVRVLVISPSRHITSGTFLRPTIHLHASRAMSAVVWTEPHAPRIVIHLGEIGVRDDESAMHNDGTRAHRPTSDLHPSWESEGPPWVNTHPGRIGRWMTGGQAQ